MFWHNLKYTLKVIVRDHALIFWTLAFPLIMATLFNLAFSNIENAEQLSIIDVAVVENAEWQEDVAFRKAFEELSREDNTARLFHTHYTSAEEADQLLAAGEIAGFLELVDGQPELTVGESDINSTILKFATEEIATQSQIIQTIAKKDPSKLAELKLVSAVRLDDQSGEHLSYTMIEYYTLIAMTCLYGGIVSMAAINRLLANMSASGKRIAVSPAPKWQLIVSGLLASYVIQLFGLTLLYFYTIGILGVDYGEHLGAVVGLSLLGSLAGLAIGVAVATLVRGNDNAKVGAIIAITMFGCFLAGMMGITMKYIVDTNLPLLNRINPANLITDGLYALYYYPTFDRFWGDMGMLALITLILVGLSIHSLRKEQYDNL